MEPSLQNYFYPEKIVIIGASSKKGSIGYELTASIIRYGYRGQLYLVNPTSASVLGINCSKNISDIKEKLDLAIILVPKLYVEETINEALIAGIRNFILITAGFRETGAEGEKIEKKITSAIKKAGGRLVGPNCMGVINTVETVKLNATFVAEHPEPGKTAFLSQSGALGAAVLNSLRETGITFSHFISVGNKADVSENDLLKYWESDQNTKVITLYLESLSDGEIFLKLFSEGKITKPVIVIKSGKTSAGMSAASSHTGALGSSDRSVDAVFGQFGILRVNTLNDLFNTAKGFEFFAVPEGNNIAVVTNAGGPAILTVDQLILKGLRLAELSEETRKKLKKVVHPEGSINNPVDLLPGGTAENYKQALEILIHDNDVQAIINIFVEPVMVKPIDVIRAIESIKSAKPVFNVFMPLPEFWNEYKPGYPGSKPIFRNPEDPPVIIQNMLKFRDIKRNQNRLSVQRTNEKIKLPTKGFLSHEQILSIIKNYEIPLAESKILSFDQLSGIETGYPYVLKAAGNEIVHKSEFKGVKLNIRSKSDLIGCASEMVNNFSQIGMDVEFFILQPFLVSKFEVLIGGFRDPDFGPMIMFGTGGKYVEQYKDTSIRSAFISEMDVEEMINDTIMGNLLKGVRGDSPTDLSKIKKILYSMAQLMLDYDEISEVDLNPLIIDIDSNLFTVDIRIKVN